MRLLYPISFPQLLFIGFLLVSIPPVLTLADGYFALNRLSTKAELAITHATAATRDSRLIDEHVTGLERLARQQLVLNDPQSLEAYSRRHTQFLDTTRRLQQEVRFAEIDAKLARLISIENGVWQSLQQSNLTQVQTDSLDQPFGQMNAIAASIVDQADARIEADTQALKTESAAARHRMLQRLWMLVPVSLLVSIGITVLIRFPFLQIEQAMRQLGEGRFKESIRISGPKDMVILGRRLDWLRSRLAELDEQKTRLLHHVSHELKTPLTALQEGTSLLSDEVSGPLTEEQREVVQILRTNCQRLRKLIENLLDYSGLRNRPALLNRTKLKLDELVQQIIADQKLAAAARGISVTGTASGLTLYADRDKLAVVLDNLISNALKFSPANGQVKVTAQAEDKHVMIQVCDNGPGIAAAVVADMFEPFVQGPPPEGNPVRGSGLGLSIVRELVTAHGGTVELLSNPPSGTCACIRLPSQETMTS